MTDQSPYDSDGPPQNPLKYLRDHIGLSQQQLADTSNVSRDTIQRLEQGKNVHVSNLAKLARALAVPVSALRSLPAARMCMEARDAAEIEQWAQHRVNEQVAQSRGWVPAPTPGFTDPQSGAVAPPPGSGYVLPAQPQAVVPPIPAPDMGPPAPAPSPTALPPAATSRPADVSALYATLPASTDPASIRQAVEYIKNYMATDPTAERDPDTQLAFIDRDQLENHIRVWANTATIPDPESWDPVVHEAFVIAGLISETEDGTAPNQQTADGTAAS